MAGQQYGAESPQAAQVLNDLGVLNGRQRRFEDAARRHAEALAIRRKIFAADGPEVAQSLKNLAETHEALKRCEDAEPLYAELVGILQKRYQPDDPRLQTVRRRHATCLHIIDSRAQ